MEQGAIAPVARGLTVGSLTHAVAPLAADDRALCAEFEGVSMADRAFFFRSRPDSRQPVPREQLIALNFKTYRAPSPPVEYSAPASQTAPFADQSAPRRRAGAEGTSKKRKAQNDSDDLAEAEHARALPTAETAKVKETEAPDDSAGPPTAPRWSSQLQENLRLRSFVARQSRLASTSQHAETRHEEPVDAGGLHEPHLPGLPASKGKESSQRPLKPLVSRYAPGKVAVPISNPFNSPPIVGASAAVPPCAERSAHTRLPPAPRSLDLASRTRDQVPVREKQSVEGAAVPEGSEVSKGWKRASFPLPPQQDTKPSALVVAKAPQISHPAQFSNATFQRPPTVNLVGDILGSANVPLHWCVLVYGLKRQITEHRERIDLAKAAKIGKDQPYLKSSRQRIVGRYSIILRYCSRDTATIAINERIAADDLAQDGEGPELSYTLLYAHGKVTGGGRMSDQIVFKPDSQLRFSYPVNGTDIDLMITQIYLKTRIKPILTIADGNSAVMRFTSIADAKQVREEAATGITVKARRDYKQIVGSPIATFVPEYDTRAWDWHDIW